MGRFSELLRAVGVLATATVVVATLGGNAVATTDTRVPTKPPSPPTAVEVGTALRAGGIPISVGVIDTTPLTKDPRSSAVTPYVRARVLTTAIAGTDDYNIGIAVYKSPRARRQVDRWTAKHVPELAVPREFRPLEASAKCGAIRVDVANSPRTFDPASVVPTVREILASSYGPC